METNDKTYAARKAGNNAKAFITMDPKNNSISVHGKFYEEEGILMRRVSFPGPALNNIAVAPENIAAEIRRREKELNPGEPSPELAAFIAEIWAEAEKLEPWFKFEN